MSSEGGRHFNTTPAIGLTGVHKRYWQIRDEAMLIKSLLPGHKTEKLEHWALKGIDLEVQRGETVGILGRNGAGKTTLLRLLAGVSRPTEGRVRIAGRVAPLIGVGVGFHQEMSGRENIYVNGMLLGLSRRQIDERMDQIMSFAELDTFIDTPVKFYSSGMFMRLGFSVAAHVDPDVLLVDEVLAVGDLAFQLKCFERMRALQKQGTTILLVSHSMHAIRLLCPRAVLLSHGSMVFDGPAEETIARHHHLLSARDDSADTGPAVVISQQVVVGANGPTNHPRRGEPLEYHARLLFNSDVDSPQIYFQVHSEDGTLAYTLFTEIGKPWRCFRAGESAELRVPFTPSLGGGTYRVSTVVFDRDGREQLGHDVPGLFMYLVPPLGTAGIAHLEATILIDERPLSQHESPLLGDAPEGRSMITSPFGSTDR